MKTDTTQFKIQAHGFEPAYLELYQTDELWRRAREAVERLEACKVCPRDCEVNRLEGETAVCKTGRHSRVSSCFPHFGEEDCLKGWNGSGTIFFSMCNLRCVFCQNHGISYSPDGVEVGPLALAKMTLDLQKRGCHNVNFVTPEHVVPQILEALPHAVDMGLRVPLVYNTGAYDSLDSIRLMEGIVDVYMPDLKFLDPDLSEKYLKARDYPQAAMRAIKEMHRQVGDLVFDENGLAKRGLLVRHLVMPGCLDETRKIMRFLAEEVSPHTFVNVMAQYQPSAKVSRARYAEINRPITAEEHGEAFQIARQAGLYRFDQRDAPFRLFAF
ncbi:MAG: radical SAM protein [Nitrospinales bacterium]